MVSEGPSCASTSLRRSWSWPAYTALRANTCHDIESLRLDDDQDPSPPQKIPVSKTVAFGSGPSRGKWPVCSRDVLEGRSAPEVHQLEVKGVRSVIRPRRGGNTSAKIVFYAHVVRPSSIDASHKQLVPSVRPMAASEDFAWKINLA